MEVSVYDATGRRVYNAKPAMKEGANQYAIGNISLNAGLYIIRVNDGEYYNTVKAMIQ